MKKKLAFSLILLSTILFLGGCFGNTLPESYVLRISIQGDGNVTPTQNVYQKNALAYINVQPAAGWKFDHWEGNNRYEVNFEGNQWQILMSSDKNLTAVFTRTDGGDPGQPDTGSNLYVSVEGLGKVSPSSGNFAKNELVNLRVQPSYGWEFSHWAGPNGRDVIGGGSDYVIVMDTDKSLVAVFQENKYSLSVDIVGKGKVEETLLGDDYAGGSLVRLRARADYGWAFQEWRGDARGKNAVIDVEVDRDLSITAVFVRDLESYTLTIKTQGKGRVTENVIADYEEGTIVELKAVPSSGWLFQEWLGDEKGKKPTLVIEMDEDKTITAVFVEDTQYYYLDVSVEGRGEVTKSPDEDEYEEYEEVTLRAIPASGWEFKEWQGDARGSSAQVRITMDSDKKVKAVFVEEERRYSLNVNISGNGQVSKSPDERDYKEGTRVSLQATPGNNSEFAGWSGDASGSSPSVQVTMDRDKNVTASFRERPSSYTVNASVGGGSGQAIKEPDKASYEHGESVRVTGEAGPGYMLQYFTVNGEEIDGQQYIGVEIQSIEQDFDIVFYFIPGQGGG